MHGRGLEPSNIYGWSLLSDEDVREYKKLQEKLHLRMEKSTKGKFSTILVDITKIIEDFLSEDNTYNHLRAFICGYLPIQDAIAINTKNLMCLLGKCKSSINVGFQEIGWHVVPIDTYQASALNKNFPLLKNKTFLARQWTIRKYIPKSEPTQQEYPNDIFDLSKEIFDLSEDDLFNQDPSEIPIY